MDINQILPLLMNNGGSSDDKSQLLAAMLAGNNSNAGGGENPAEMLAKMKGGGSPTDMLSLMNMMQNRNKKAPDKTAEGLNSISEFAPPDILGTMFKMLGNRE